MFEEFTCEVRVRFRGKDLALNKIVSRVELEDMLPVKGPVDPLNFGDIYKRQERRQRFIDMVSAQIATAMTDGLYTV